MPKIKKKKLPSIPKINRKLFRIWSEKIHERADSKCEYCGLKVGENGKNGKPINKLDSHHLISRIKKNSFLKWDINNGICLCPSCHKFGEDSFHKSPVTTIYWFMKNHPDRLEYIMGNFDVKVDLNSREVLASIENSLVNNIPIDIELLKSLTTTTTTTTEPDLLSAFQELAQPSQK
jgi:hypothetical protein